MRRGIHWAARDALASGACRRFANLDLIVVDGFTDFTRTQHEILRHLAARAQQLCHLPSHRCGSGRSRARPVRQNRRHARRAEATLSTAQNATSRAASIGQSRARSHLQHVFRHPQSPPPADALDALPCIEIVEAAGAHDEIIQLARRIKTLLSKRDSSFLGSGQYGGELDLSPFPCQTTSSSSSAPSPTWPRGSRKFSVASAFPTRSNRARGSRRAAVFRTLVALLQLDADDWPFRRVVSIITNNTLVRDCGACAPSGRLARARSATRQRQTQTLGNRCRPCRSGERRPRIQRIPPTPHYSRRRLAAGPHANCRRARTAAAQAAPAEWTAALDRLGAELGLAAFSEARESNRPTQGRLVA